VIRIAVIVEGATEESFVKGPLAEALWPRQVYLTPIILGVLGHKGGGTSYARVQKDLLRQLKQDPTAYCSTMIDFYGLGRGFPGTPPPAHLTNIQKVEHIERDVKDDICGRIPDFRPDVRLIPYLSLHEYEGLLFSDPDALAQALTQPNLAHRFHQIRIISRRPRTSMTAPRPHPPNASLRFTPRIEKSSRAPSPQERLALTECAGNVRISGTGSNSLRLFRTFEIRFMTVLRPCPRQSI
jgi:hypothetical protein